MAGLIKLFEVDYRKIAAKDKEDYKAFLTQTMNEFIKKGVYNEYKVIKDKQFFRFFIYPPVINEVEFVENEAQREGRLELLNFYRSSYNKKLAGADKDTFMKSSEWIPATSVESFLGITRRTLYNILDDEDSEIIMESYDKEMHVQKASLLQYINQRHIVGTNLGFESLYKKMRALMSKSAADKELEKEDKIKEIINSSEYQSLWAKYLQKVPEDKRVLREREKNEVEGYSIYLPISSENLFEKYNPNIRIAESTVKKIPKMYSVNHIAALLDTTPRTVLRYCEYGYIPYFKIGGKYMFSMNDFSKGKNILKHQEQSTKKNVGRKRKLEIILSDNDLLSDDIMKKFKDSSLDKIKKIYFELEEVIIEEKYLEERLSYMKEVDESGDINDIPALNAKLKEIKAKRNSFEKLINTLRREFFNENLKEFEDNHKEIIDMIYERRNSIKQLKSYMKNKKDKAFKESIEKTIEELEQNIKELKGKLIFELI